MIIALSILALGLAAFFIIVKVLPSGVSQGEHRAAPPSSASPTQEARPADTSRSTEQSPAQESESTPDETVASDPETTGACPEGQSEAYMGTTAEYTVRICDISPNSDESTYVGGSDELGYVVFPATVSNGSSGTTLTAENGSTSYKINYLGLTIFKNDEEVKNQEWQSGNMEDLHPGGD